jgi:putative glycosyltransferase (TIGR04372 family)
MIIDYAGTDKRSEFMDVFLGSTCYFCISNGTGFDAIPYIFRRPVIYIDHVPMGIFNTFSSKFMATSKIHWSQRKERALTIEEIFASNLPWHTKTKNFEDDGIILLESSPEDIASAVLEMEGRLSGTWIASDEDERLQQYFWSIYPANELHGEIRSRVATAYLKRDLQICRIGEVA